MPAKKPASGAAKKAAVKKSSVKKAAAPKKVAAPKKTAAPKKAVAPKKAAQKASTAKVQVQKAKDVQLDYLVDAYKFSAARKMDSIHPRKVIPKVEAGEKVTDMLPTAPMAFEDFVPAPAIDMRAGTAPRTPTDTITLVKSVQINDVGTSDTASHVCEPSVAMNGDVIFYTGNWFAALSVDGGNNFRYINPYNTFTNPAGMQFCCDQVVHYVKSIDTFVWLLQYGTDSSGKNLLRIAFATTAKVKTGVWRFFDITPAALALGPGVWLDFPDLADGKNMLYMTTNCFAGQNWTASAVVRIRLSSFTTGTLSATRYISRSSSSIRVAQNGGTTAFFAAHNSTSSLRLFSWSESAPSPTFRDITIASWANTGYSSTTPDGRNWLQRADARMTGATIAGNEAWFAWGSAKGGINRRPHPFVQIARINTSSLTLIENINLWEGSAGVFYANLGTNSNSEVGVSFMIGGGTRYPTHAVGILTGTRRQITTFASTRGPADNKWGDYLGIRKVYPNQKLFCASGYSLLSSGSGRSDATPNLTIFGRSSDV